MSLVALMLLPLLAGYAFALPIDIGGIGDYGYGYDYGYGVGLGGIGLGLGGMGLGLGYGGIGAGLAYAPTLASDVLDVGYPAADYAYAGYPRTVDYSKENFVRGSYFGGTEVGTRDEVTVRPSVVRTPYSRFYSSYFPYSLSRGINRYPLYGSYYLPRASLLGRVSGDSVYLKR